MKLFAAIAAATLMIACNASASEMYVVGLCGTFANPAPNAPLTGSWTCPTAISLGISGALFVNDEHIIYYNDYSSGLASSVSIMTKWTFSGASLAYPSDTTTSNGGSVSNPAVSMDGAPFVPLTNLPPVILAGYRNDVSSFGTVTVNWTNSATAGAALQATGYAFVEYSYDPTLSSASPEPVSMLLFGSGLLAISLIGRRKLARK